MILLTKEFILIMGWKNMKNRIVDVFKVANRLLVTTVENPDFEDLRVNHTQ